jgi:hypothetical protein
MGLYHAIASLPDQPVVYRRLDVGFIEGSISLNAAKTAE